MENTTPVKGKPTFSDVVNKLLGPVIFSLVLLILWVDVYSRLSPLPSVEKLQEAVARELRGPISRWTAEEKRKWNGIRRDTDGDKVFIFDDVNGMIVDHEDQSVKPDYVDRGDYFDRHLAGYCTFYFAAAVILAVMMSVGKHD